MQTSAMHVLALSSIFAIVQNSQIDFRNQIAR
jgi:hypothetical protein